MLVVPRSIFYPKTIVVHESLSSFRGSIVASGTYSTYDLCGTPSWEATRKPIHLGMRLKEEVVCSALLHRVWQGQVRTTCRAGLGQSAATKSRHAVGVFVLPYVPPVVYVHDPIMEPMGRRCHPQNTKLNASVFLECVVWKHEVQSTVWQRYEHTSKYKPWRCGDTLRRRQLRRVIIIVLIKRRCYFCYAASTSPKAETLYRELAAGLSHILVDELVLAAVD